MYQFGTIFPLNFHQFLHFRAHYPPEFSPAHGSLCLFCIGGAIIKAAHILVIEKDESLAVNAVSALEEAGYRAERVNDAADGLKKLYDSYPDLIIVARELPMVDGQDACLRMRQACYLPMIVLGSQGEAAKMLELGADAYMTKPISFSELVARVRALLRRKPKLDPSLNEHGLGIEKHVPGNGGGPNGLTPTEYRLASCLIFNKGRLMSYNRLITEVWGRRGASFHNLQVYIRRLRSKLVDGSILHVRGLGYCFKGLAGE